MKPKSIDNDPHKASASPLSSQCMGVAFLITASELRNRKTKRRRHAEAIRRKVAIGLKAKGK